jgi:glycosyltransferase involved in cell wall biosynthesis
MIVANLATSLEQEDALRETLRRIVSNVDRINLVVGEARIAPSWLANISNLVLVKAHGEFSGANRFLPRVDEDDFVFLLDENIHYPADYVRRMLAVYEDIALDRKIIGIQGTIYPDFFDGASMLVHATEDALAKHQLVNQLDTATLLCRGVELPGADLLGEAHLVDLRFAAHSRRNGVPLICVARGRNWLRPREPRSDMEVAPPEDFVREAQRISGFGRLPLRYLNEDGFIPRRASSAADRLILNGSFGGVLAQDGKSAPMEFFAPHWQVDFLGNTHEIDVEFSAAHAIRGLRIDVAHASRWIRLLTQVDLAALKSRIVEASITLRTPEESSTRPQIDGIFLLLREPDGKWTLLSRIFGAILARQESTKYSTRIRIPAVDAHTTVYFCVQLSGQPGTLEIDSITLSQSAAMSGLGKVEVQHAAPEPAPDIRLLNSGSAMVAEDDKPRMSVIGWSLGHNPVGRAYNLAELAEKDFCVELAGTLIPRFGASLWPPLSDASIPIHGFVAGNMKSLLSGACALAESTPCDMVYVSKPRLPGMLLGMALSAHNDCPLILDIDDLELAFLKERAPLPFSHLDRAFAAAPQQFDEAASEIWSRFVETLIAEADAITVSNGTLKSRYGGIVVRHARDETKFVPDDARRREVRAAFGFSDDDKVILFLGTPRQHKGLMRIADAVIHSSDARLKLCIVGLDETSSFGQELAGCDSARIRIFGPQSFARLPDIIRCGDAVCLLQDSASPISEFQIPAKLSEALAMGLPALVSRVAPFSDVIASGAVLPVDTDEELHRALNGILDGSQDDASHRQLRKDIFLSEFSYAANIPRLREACALARERYARAPQARLATLSRIVNYMEAHLARRPR